MRFWATGVTVVTAIRSGTHTIFIGEMLSAQFGDIGDPLRYYNPGYKKVIAA